MNNKKVVYLITGAIGAGKTTFSKKLLHYLGNIEYIGADYYFFNHFRRKGKDEPLCYEDAKKYCLYKIRKLMQEGKPFVLEKVMSSSIDLSLLDLFAQYGYYISTFFVRVNDIETLMSRANDRVMDGWYIVPEEKIIRHWTNHNTNLDTIRRKSDSFYIIDTSACYKLAFCEESGIVFIDEEGLCSNTFTDSSCDTNAGSIGTKYLSDFIVEAMDDICKNTGASRCPVDDSMLFLNQHVTYDEEDKKMINEILEDA